MSQTQRPDAPDRSGARCLAVRDVLDRVGDKWSALVIAALGAGTLRFGELRRQVDGVSQRMLTVTVRHLERDGLVTRVVHPEIPLRVEYSLTELGRSLHETIAALVTWSTDHMEDMRVARERYDGSASGHSEPAAVVPAAPLSAAR